MSRRKQKFPTHLKSCGSEVESPVSSAASGSGSECGSNSSSSSSSSMIMTMGGDAPCSSSPASPAAAVATRSSQPPTTASPKRQARHFNTETVKKNALQNSVNGNISEASHKTMSSVTSVASILSTRNVVNSVAASSAATSTTSIMPQQNGSQRVPVNGQVVQGSSSKNSEKKSHSPLSPLTVPYVIVSSSQAIGIDSSQANKQMTGQITSNFIQNKLSTGANDREIKEEIIPVNNRGSSSLRANSSAIISRITNLQKTFAEKKSYIKYEPEIPSVECIVNIEEGNKVSSKAKKKEYMCASDTEEVNKASSKTDKSEYVNTCPVCYIPFKSKRSFNKHILVHCQLVNGSNEVGKRPFDQVFSPSPEKKRIRENAFNEQLELLRAEESMSLPLDLSCRTSSKSFSTGLQEQLASAQLCGRPVAASTPEPHDDRVPSHNLSALSERGPLEDENENLVNEAREREAAFFNMGVNEAYLTEDSTGLEPPPALPLYQTHSNNTRKVRVCSDDGPPMVYTVSVHAEQ
ncbi:unnamed protein product, partial [Meganyctiphanes norvegica]